MQEGKGDNDGADLSANIDSPSHLREPILSKKEMDVDGHEEEELKTGFSKK